MVKIKGDDFVLVGCRELNKEEIEFRKELMQRKPQKKKGYCVFVKNKKNYKRSRVMVELACRVELKRTIHIHHINEDKSDDRYENFEMLNDSDHISKTHAGKRCGKTTNGDFYQK